jgi:hypothetical protein
MEYIRNGRTWRSLGTQNYTNRAGQEVELTRWTSKCVVCQQPIFCKTPTIDFAKSNAFGLARCDLHKKAQNKARPSDPQNDPQ